METIYTSKKNPDVTAKIVKKPNEMTVILEYLTGDKAGETTTITTSTLQRYWKKSEVEEQKSVAEILNVDMDEVNKPYAPEVTPHYIPKPESVVEYEENKKRTRSKRTFDVPTDYDTFANILAENGVKMKRVNKGYISLPDNTKLKLLGGGVGILASGYVAEAFAQAGYKSRACIEKGTPFRFDITTEDAYNNMYKILSTLVFEGGTDNGTV
jgi:hypothetical protein